MEAGKYFISLPEKKKKISKKLLVILLISVAGMENTKRDDREMRKKIKEKNEVRSRQKKTQK